MRIVVAALALVAVSCGAPSVGPAVVDLHDFWIGVEAAVWEAGPQSIRVRNDGGYGHSLVVSREDGTVVGATDLLQPGETSRLDLDLPPGAYVLTCRIVVGTPEEVIVDHYQEGMWATVSVTGDP